VAASGTTVAEPAGLAPAEQPAAAAVEEQIEDDEAIERR
jgi:hypothetical protein